MPIIFCVSFNTVRDDVLILQLSLAVAGVCSKLSEDSWWWAELLGSCPDASVWMLISTQTP